MDGTYRVKVSVGGKWLWLDRAGELTPHEGRAIAVDSVGLARNWVQELLQRPDVDTAELVHPKR